MACANTISPTDFAEMLAGAQPPASTARELEERYLEEQLAEELSKGERVAEALQELERIEAPDPGILAQAQMETGDATTTAILAGAVMIEALGHAFEATLGVRQAEES